MEQQIDSPPQQGRDGEVSEHNGFFSRLGEWFKGSGSGAAVATASENRADELSPANGEELPLQDPLHEAIHTDTTHPGGSPVAVRSTLFRPWAKRDAAIEGLQQGFGALSDLMVSIRDNLDRSNQRQDELLGYLSHLPAALEQLPESNRVQAETLKAIHEQMKGQVDQQGKLGEILERISQSDGQSIRALDSLQEHVDQLRRHDEAVAQNLSHVGDAMEGLGKNTAASAQVLQQLRDNSASRDGEIQRILQQQTSRFTTLLVVATLLLVAALVGVAALGYFFLKTTGRL